MGRPLPYGNYPNPIKISRKILFALRSLGVQDQLTPDTTKVNWNDSEDVADCLSAQTFAQATQGATEAAEWIRKNPALYQSAVVEQQGFEVKRYRIQCEYPDNSTIILRELEDYEIAKRYAEECKAGWISRGWILVANQNKGIDVSKNSRNPSTGEAQLVRFCTFRIRAVGATEATKPKNQRYPSEEETKLWDLLEQTKTR